MSKEPDARWLAGPRVRVDSLPNGTRVLCISGDEWILRGRLKDREWLPRKADCQTRHVEDGGLFIDSAEVVVLEET